MINIYTVYILRILWIGYDTWIEFSVLPMGIFRHFTPEIDIQKHHRVTTSYYSKHRFVILPKRKCTADTIVLRVL